VNSQLDEIAGRFKEHSMDLSNCAKFAFMKDMTEKVKKETLMVVETSLVEREQYEAEVALGILGKLRNEIRGKLMDDFTAKKGGTQATIHSTCVTYWVIEKARRKFLQWLDPPSCRDALETVRRNRHEKTGMWILAAKEYLS
jgi:hypothetical protein